MNEVKTQKQGLGVMSQERIGPSPAIIEPSIIERFKKLDDLTGTLSDCFDAKGINGVVTGSAFRPTIFDGRIIGRAITVRNTPHPRNPHAASRQGDNLMGEIEVMHQAESGDVLVVQGVMGASNLGGVMSTIAQAQGIIGAIVDGGVRDVDHTRAIGFPVWSRDVSPMTGKWRIETREVNKAIKIGSVAVSPGDLVVADATGICFIPSGDIDEVLRQCEAAYEKELVWIEKLNGGFTLPELVKLILNK